MVILLSWNLQNSGQIAPLDEIVKLKEKYRFRVLLDESNSFGVLGKAGRGLTEFCGVPVYFRNPQRKLNFLKILIHGQFVIFRWSDICRLKR